ncbi:MAG: tetratricopeptide repeat protein [Thermodesulfobacteriota bacterium]
MKLSENWKEKGLYLKLGLLAAVCVLLAGCSGFSTLGSSLSSQFPMVAMQMDSRYLNGSAYDRALLLYEKGLLVESREKARAVPKNDKHYADARRLIAAINIVVLQISKEHLDLGEKYEKAGIYEKALSEYRRSLEYNPANLKASSRVYVLNEMIKAGRQPDIARVNLVEKKDAKKKVKREKAARETKALKKKERPREEDPGYKASVHYANGKIYLDAGAYAKASEEFNLALRFVPSYSDAEELLALSEKERDKAVGKHLRKGIGYFQAEEMELAIKEWEIVLRHDPENKTAKDYKARAEIILERLRNIRKQQAGRLMGQPL